LTASESTGKFAVSPFKIGFAVVSAPHVCNVAVDSDVNNPKCVRFAPDDQSADAAVNASAFRFVVAAGAVPVAARQSAGADCLRAYAPPDGSVKFPAASVGVVDDSPMYRFAAAVNVAFPK
jgi:hypothetical protein